MFKDDPNVLRNASVYLEKGALRKEGVERTVLSGTYEK